MTYKFILFLHCLNTILILNTLFINTINVIRKFYCSAPLKNKKVTSSIHLPNIETGHINI